MSRYLERAEHTARLVDVDCNFVDQSPEQGAGGGGFYWSQRTPAPSGPIDPN